MGKNVISAARIAMKNSPKTAKKQKSIIKLDRNLA